MVSQIQTENLNIPVGISKIPAEGVWTRVDVSLATSKWNQELSNGEAQQKRCSHARFCHLGSSAVGGSARLNLAPGSGRCLSPPLPPVSGRPSNEHCFIVFQERWTGLMRAHLLAGLCDLRPTLWSRHLWSSRTSKHKFSPWSNSATASTSAGSLPTLLWTTGSWQGPWHTY